MKINYENLAGRLESVIGDKDATHGLKRAVRRLKKELVIYSGHQKTIKNKKFDLNGNADRVQIGGGSHVLEGYFNIDIFPPADLIYDVREGIPLKNRSARMIFSEHFLEHIDYPVSAKKFINECYRILKNEGEVVIGVPDGSLPILAYLKKDKKFYRDIMDKWYSKRDCLNDFNTYIDLVNYHFRDQDDSDKYTPHLWAYDYDKLKSLLFDAGFSSVKKWRFNEQIANKERRFGSIYVIAKK